MKSWILASFFTAAAVPAAFADEGVTGCQVDDTRQRMERVVTDPEAGSAPAPEVAQTVSRPAIVQRQAQAQPADRAPQQQPQRRRSGKRIPDAELIGPRGAL
jgi:hypothetical protein